MRSDVPDVNDGRKATKKDKVSQRVMLLGGGGNLNERGGDIEEVAHRVIDGQRIRDEEPANRRRAIV